MARGIDCEVCGGEGVIVTIAGHEAELKAHTNRVLDKLKERLSDDKVWPGINHGELDLYGTLKTIDELKKEQYGN